MKISIAMATYNGGKYLREQLDSLYAQTMPPDEVVVTDDRSTDDTAAILKEYHQKYGLKYFINDINLGVNRNFLKAISLCSNPLIMICDQDDIWLPCKIETLYNTIINFDNSKPIVVSSQAIRIDKDKNILFTPHNFKSSSDYRLTFIDEDKCQGSSLIFNEPMKNIILSELPKFDFMYDYVICCLAVLFGLKYNLSEPLMLYRIHSNNVTARESTIKNPPLVRLQNFINYYPRLVGFITDSKYEFMSSLYIEYQQRLDSKLEIKIFIKKMSDIHKNGLWTGVRTILSLKEIRIYKRLFISLISILVASLRGQYHPKTKSVNA